MWKATYWTDENERPDLKPRHLQNEFGNGIKWLQKTMRAGNVSGELATSGHPQSVMQALAELRSGESGVQWDGEKITVKPIINIIGLTVIFSPSHYEFQNPLSCVNFSKSDERNICNVTVRLSNGHADYLVNAVSLQALSSRPTLSPVIPVTLPTSTFETLSTSATTCSPPTTEAETGSLVPSLDENECGGWIQVTTSSRGYLRSPTALSSSNYPNSLSCTWLITGPPDRGLKFTEESSHPFDIPDGCESDKLVIGDTEYCRDNPLDTVTVSSSSTTVSFRTDSYAYGSGFFIKIEAF